MTRKIKAYKLIKEYPGSKRIGYIEEYTTGEFSKYPEFWEPIYHSYNIGDWITVTYIDKNDTNHWLNNTTLRTFQLTAAPTNFFKGQMWSTSGPKQNNKYTGYGIPEFWFRMATKEEISYSKVHTISMYSSNKGNFDIIVIAGKAYYEKDNKELPIHWIKDIINSYGDIIIDKNVINPYPVKINSIDVGCYSGTKKEDWEKVYELLK